LDYGGTDGIPKVWVSSSDDTTISAPPVRAVAVATIGNLLIPGLAGIVLVVKVGDWRLAVSGQAPEKFRVPPIIAEAEGRQQLDSEPCCHCRPDSNLLGFAGGMHIALFG
jgi:hypothetical protein